MLLSLRGLATAAQRAPRSHYTLWATNELGSFERCKFWEQVDPIFVAAGFKHAAVIGIDSRGKRQLFVAGLNSSGQLGMSNTQNDDDFKRVKLFAEDDVLSVACGRAHTVVQTSRGVFSAGAGFHGQLGTGSSSDSVMFEPLRKIGNGGHVTQIACGWDHTAMLAAGEVLTCGWAADGQTGLGHTKRRARPTAVTGLPEIESISSHSDTTFAVGRDGSLWAWGNNEYGQTGVKSSDLQLLSPQAVPIPPNTFSRVYAGGSCSVGLHADGSLSLISSGPLPATTSAVADSTLPWPRLRPAVPVVDVAVGGDYFYLIHQDGTLSSIGKTQWSVRAGTPPTVAEPHQPGQVACGFDRVFVIRREK
eukprot:m.9547 g.9547  ORF g.9547 m.9547 type:complete len:362 (-) comp5435_c0_seq1:134-1219(-)